MKKFFVVLMLMMIFTIKVFAQTTATYTTSKVLVNGEEVKFEAYNINGNNYFKLRDVALAVSGTSASFEVTWDGSNNAINILTGKSYTKVGGELILGDGTSKEAFDTTSKICLNGEEISADNLNAYNISGNNYFKLRDLGSLFNFGVDWDGVANCIIITTDTGLDSYKEIGEIVSVATIKDNKNAVYSLTTDDNYDYTNKWINKKIEELDLKATMGLITDTMGAVGKLSWEDAQALVKTGRWGVANHTKAHRQDVFGTLSESELDVEINGARKTLLNKFPKEKLLCMYTPGGITNDLIKEVVGKQHLVLRHAGGGSNNLPILKENLLALKSEAIFSNTSLETMNLWIDNAITNGQWCVEMWHGVGYEDGASWGGNCIEENAETHLKYVSEKKKEGKLWVTTLDEAAVYLTEFNNAKLTEIKKTDSELVFSLTDGLDDKIYDEELTVNIKIPNIFKNAVVTQGEKTLKTVIGDGQISINVKPDSGDITVKFD